MISKKEYKKTVYEFGELAHQKEELLEVIHEYMETLLLVQEKLDITEHEIKRDSFEVIEGKKEVTAKIRDSKALEK